MHVHTHTTTTTKKKNKNKNQTKKNMQKILHIIANGTFVFLAEI